MSRFNPNEQDSETVYEAASQWHEKCLIGGKSLFEEGRDLWSLSNLDELNVRYVQNPDAGEGSFLEKLEDQLRDGTSECKQLMAELSWLLLLFASKTSPAKKRSDITTIWSWSGYDLPQNSAFLSDAALGGIGHTGTAYNVQKWREFVYVIDALRSFRAKSDAEQIKLASDPWGFADWLTSVPSGESRQFRHIMLNLIFPDFFERISTGKDKVAILSEFENLPQKEIKKRDWVEIDRSLFDLRTKLETDSDDPIDFYNADIVARWRKPQPKTVNLKSAIDDTSAALSGHVGDPDDSEDVTEYDVNDIIAEGAFLDEKTLNGIVERLAVKKNAILQGPPGTGKTWLAKRLAKVLIGRNSPRSDQLRSVQFHPSLSYEDFVRGYRPSSKGLVITDGVFLQVVEAAKAKPNTPHVLIIEEINRGNPAQVFGEMLTLLENTKRSSDDAMELAYRRFPGERVHVPANLYLIGTMNIADRSLALVDLALRRRFAFISLTPLLNHAWANWCQKCGLDLQSVKRFSDKIEALNARISEDRTLGEQFRIGHSYVTPSMDADIGDANGWFREIVATEIGPLLDEYWFDAPDQAKDAVSELLKGL